MEPIENGEKPMNISEASEPVEDAAARAKAQMLFTTGAS
jgi:hypothetical protein